MGVETLQSFEKGLVSVIIPVYKAEEFLAQTLDSVFSQTYANIEVIIMNDCSPDNSEGIIFDYMKKHKNLLYYKQKTNMGVAVARNQAVKIAKGQYIAFLDSDDLWNPMKIERQIEVLNLNESSPMSYTAIHMIDERGDVIKGKRKVSSQIGYYRLLHNTMIATSSVVINRNVVNTISMPNRKSCEDYSLWLTITEKFGPAIGINDDLVAYRKSCNQVTNNRIRELRYFFNTQVEDHNINKLVALLNTFIYALIAAKKHYLR